MFHRKKEGNFPVKAREGSSLVIVICVSAFLTAFALAMVYTAGAMLSRTNRRLEQERSYQLARSFSQVLDEELKRYSYVDNEFKPKPEDPGYDLIAEDKSFYRYVVKFLEGEYGEYDPDHPDKTVFHFTAGESSGTDQEKVYGNIQVALYKEAEEKGEMSGTTPANASTDDIETKPIQRYAFRVKVTVDVEGTTFSYETKYRQMVRYKVAYTYDDKTIVKTDDGWHYGSALGLPCNFSDTDEIRYEYVPGGENVKECIFQNAFEEEEGNI